MTITTHQAKKIIKQALEERNIPYDKLTARTWDFTDLARSQWVAVTVHGWDAKKYGHLWKEIDAVAVGFGVSAAGYPTSSDKHGTISMASKI